MPHPGRARHGAPAWYEGRRDALLAIAAEGTPCYVTHGPTVDARLAALRALPGLRRVLYALKANPHPALVSRLARGGAGFETVSPGEIARVREAAPGAFVLFTPNFAPRSEVAAAFAAGVRVTIDDLYPFERWPELLAGREVFVRLDPGVGRGHHAHVRTGGERSKFGIPADALDAVAARAEALGVRIVGLHAHVGSGILDPASWTETAAFLGAAARRFPDARVLDLGGGLGVPDRPRRRGLDLDALGAGLAAVAARHPEHELWLEPGRFLVAEAGVLLTTVTQVKRKGDVTYVGVDAGMHTLVRPALYGAHHPVVSVSRPHAPPDAVVTVVGPICESGDVLARDRRLALPREGDVLLLAVAGAYGASMASTYNLRPLPREVVLE